MPGPVRVAVTTLSPPKTARLTGAALYLIWKLIDGVRAAMQETSMVRTSPTSRFFCTTEPPAIIKARP